MNMQKVTDLADLQRHNFDYPLIGKIQLDEDFQNMWMALNTDFMPYDYQGFSNPSHESSEVFRISFHFDLITKKCCTNLMLALDAREEIILGEQSRHYIFLKVLTCDGLVGWLPLYRESEDKFHILV